MIKKQNSLEGARFITFCALSEAKGMVIIMKIVNLNLEKNCTINYRPLFIYKNYIYIVKEDCEENAIENEKKVKKSIYEGVYRYNIIENVLEKIEVSNCIMDYYYDYSKIYYMDIEGIDKKYVATFFEIDGNKEKRLASIQLPSYIGVDSLLNVYEKLQPFALKNGFISYLYDISLHSRVYDHLDNENEFKLYVYDIKEKRKYENLDKEFCKNGFDKKIIFKVNDIEYILLNSALYEELDKYEYLYDADENNIEDLRGAKDRIYLIEIEKFISEIKQGKEHISYKEIESIGQEGTVRFIHMSGCKIYYTVRNFRKGYFELVIYDISNDKYQRIKLESCSRLLKITEEGEFVYLYNYKNKYLMELSGKDFHKRRKISISGNVLGVLESKYIVLQTVLVIEGKRGVFCEIYDMDSLTVVDRFQGKAKVFEKENVIVVY